MKTNTTPAVRLTIDDPIPLVHGTPGDQVWGHYQFPNLSRMADGRILAAWEVGSDDYSYSAAIQRAVSADNGRTWQSITPRADELPGYPMKNGKIFCGFTKKGAHPIADPDRYTPARICRDSRLYFAEDLDEPEDTRVFASQRDPVTGITEQFEVTVNWPYQPISIRSDGKWNGCIYPATMVFALCNSSGFIELDGDLYYVLYTRGFDSTAKTRKEAVYPYCGWSGCYVFRSADCGRTWDFLSQILPDADTFREDPSFEGFDEPKMARLPDGSIGMLFRTGSANPSYFVRSTDRCRTWSKPVKFDDIGVFPQLLTLKNGVTLASYGRPSLKVRATLDPSGLVWDEPVVLMERKTVAEADSCCYTGLLALDDCTALMIHSDFHFPHPDGGKARAVVVRTIRTERL